VIRDSPKSASQVFRAATAMSTLSGIDTPFGGTVGSPAFGKPQPAPYRQARTGEADFPCAEAGARSGVPTPVQQRVMDLPPDRRRPDSHWLRQG